MGDDLLIRIYLMAQFREFQWGKLILGDGFRKNMEGGFQRGKKNYPAKKKRLEKKLFQTRGGEGFS